MEWPRYPLSRLVDIVGGGTPSKSRTDFWAGETPWVSPKDMNGREVFDTADHITEAAVEQSATQVVPSGSVLIVVRSGILAHRFPIAIARRPVALNQDLKALLSHAHLLPEYLAVALESLSTTVLVHCVKRGATVHSVDVGKLKALEVPLPPLSEQRRIVEILDQADRLRRLRAEADATADRVLPALFMEMFGDPTTNPRGWTLKPLGELALHLTSGSRGWAKYTGRGSGLFLRTQDILNGEIVAELLSVDPPEGAEAERTALRDGDVVVTITGIVGKAATFRGRDRDVYVSQHVALVRPDRRLLHPDFLTAYANLPLGTVPMLARFQYGQTKPGLGFRELTTSLIPLPPIEVQTKFAAREGSLRELRLASARAAQKLASLWKVLEMHAFAGGLTTSWREAHMKELLQEMEQQARAVSQPTGVRP
jgi:type I restriction enzyme S subunit